MATSVEKIRDIAGLNLFGGLLKPRLRRPGQLSSLGTRGYDSIILDGAIDGEMSMSSEYTNFLLASGRARLGPWLAVLIIWSITSSCYDLIRMLPLFWQTLSTFHYGLTIAQERTLDIFLLRSIAGLIASLLLLIYRRSAAVTIMILQLVFACLVTVIGGVDFVEDHSGDGDFSDVFAFWVPSLLTATQVLYVLISNAGWIAYLLTAPRMTGLYAGRPPSVEASNDSAVLPWRPLIFGLPIWALTGLSAIIAIRLAPLEAFEVLGSQVYAPPKSLLTLGAAISCVVLQIILAGLLNYGQTRWQWYLVLFGLWLPAIFASLQWLGLHLAPGQFPVVLQTMPWPYEAAYSALGWSAYLLESPYIRRRFFGALPKSRSGKIGFRLNGLR
ncbi:MAG TPA: hypothetical protein VM659_06585 [Dongiaceae bacterium]|nr:hypothetical protein [Dongiaceae bacterium]